jgi:hypothetical protein
MIKHGLAPDHLLADILQVNGILSVMVGMKQLEHVKRNLKTVRQLYGAHPCSSDSKY